MRPSLKVMIEGSFLDIRDACKRQPDLSRETLISALLLLPLEDQNIKRVQLGEAFRRSLQAGRQSTPYRLHSVISACKEGKMDGASLEAKFFGHGGARAVTALAVAAADNNDVMLQLEDLGNEELKAFLESIDAIDRHPDLLFMAEAMDRKRLSKTSKRTYLVRPRPSRSTKKTNVDASQNRKSSQRSHRRVCEGDLNRDQSINVVHYRGNPAFSYQPSSPTRHTDTVKQTSTGKYPYGEDTIMDTRMTEFEYADMFNSGSGNNRLPTEESYPAGLDGIDSAPPSLDVGGSDSENFGIDLDQLSAL